MVPNTSDDLPEPETPVNTVSRRLGISTLTSFRLFTRAPWTRIRSWLSASIRRSFGMGVPLFCRVEIQGDAVDAVTKASRRRTVVEDVAEVPTTAAAVHFSPRHAVAAIQRRVGRP